jgi:hypothetical protein
MCFTAFVYRLKRFTCGNENISSQPPVALHSGYDSANQLVTGCLMSTSLQNV